MTPLGDNPETEDFRPRQGIHALLAGFENRAAKRVIFAFVIASAAHLWLADAWVLDWVPANAVYLLGLALLCFRAGALAWMLCAIGLLLPLLFLRDQLTQSAFLLVIAVSGAAHATLANKRTDAAGRESHELRFVAGVRGLVLVLYGLAVFHKLNADFFAPETSCAVYGLDEVWEYWKVGPGPEVLNRLVPTVVVAVEAAIPLLYLLRMRQAARLVAVAFHIPLTVTMAPAFAFVTLVGHVAYIDDGEWDQLVAAARRHAKWVVPAGLVVTAASLALHGKPLPEVGMIPKELVMWCTLFLLGATLRSVDPSPWPRPPTRHGRRTSIATVAVFLINGLTPYSGLQYQHAGAMLSNLRVDEGCWNHYLVPEAVRISDDYVRVDEVWFREPGHLTEYEDIVLDQLWSPPQILQMRRNWCRPEVRPFHMAGTFRGHAWQVQDLCDEEEPWPFENDGILGVSVFDDFLRFQKNLERQCPQACIH